MNPTIVFNSDNNDTLSFTLSGVNVSIANAIRRTILSDIPIVVFRTAPYEKNKANIIVNTTRLNNEIIKQRLSCIPIHIKQSDQFPHKNFVLEVDVENITTTTMFVTTANFVIKEIATGKPLDETKTKEIFPANDYTSQFIDFVRLRPKVFEEMPGEKIPGEKIHLTCEFDIGTAKEDGMFNVVSSCAYGNTIDDVARDTELQKKKQQWRDEGKNEGEIKFESDNWLLLDGMRVFKKDSFDFIVQTIGIYSNYELTNTACEILIKKLDELDTLIDKDELTIQPSQNTMSNCYDIILVNEDYTIGKVIEYLLYTRLFETEIITYCGFKKMHPHDNESIVRIAYSSTTDKSVINGHLKECIEIGKGIFSKIKKDLLKVVKK